MYELRTNLLFHDQQINIENSIFTLFLSGPPKWVIKPYHNCYGHDMSPKLNATDLADCISQCQAIMDCVGVVFDANADIENCTPKSLCYGRERFVYDDIHTAYIGKYSALDY